MSILAKAVQTTAESAQTIYIVPAGNKALLSLNVCNRSEEPVKVRVALLGTSEISPTNEDYIEYDTTILGNGVLIREGLLLSTSEKISVTADSEDVTYVVTGLAETA